MKIMAMVRVMLYITFKRYGYGDVIYDFERLWLGLGLCYVLL